MERVRKKWRNKSKKWQREEEEHWELKGVKNKDGGTESVREGKQEGKKKVRSKHKFKSFKWKQAEMSTSHFF